MLNKGLKVGLLSVSLMLPSPQAFPSETKSDLAELSHAANLYHENRHEFKVLSDYALLFESIKEINPVFDVEKTPFPGPKYGEFDEVTAVAYRRMLRRMAELDIESLRVERFALTGSPDRIVSFRTRSRGFGLGSESFVIERLIGTRTIESLYGTDDTVCLEVDPPEWYVCHSVR